jgi:hypothetical protein
VTGSLRHPNSQGSRSPWLLPSLGMAALWALYVAVRFALLKELHLPQLFETIGQRLPFILGAFAAAAVVGFVTGFLLPVVLRRGCAATWKVVLGLSVLLALGTASFFLTRRTLGDTSDGMHVVVLIVLASIAGAGLSVGVRFSSRPIHRGLFALLLTLPVLAVGAIGRELLTLGACLAILLTAHAVGGWILAGIRAIGSEGAHLDSEPVVTVGLGLVALSAVTFVLGLAGAASRTGLLLLLAASLIGALRTIPSTAGRIRRFLTGPAVLPSPVFAATAFALATLLAVFLVAAVAPEVGSDALGLRVAGPARFVESGGFSPEPFSIWSYGMIGGEVLYSLFLPLFGFSVAKIVSLLLAATVLVSVSVRLLGTDGFAAGGPWLLALFTGTLVWWQFASGFVDIPQAFFYFGCLAAVRLWMANRGRTGWLFAAGLLGGTATAIKLNGAGSIAIAAFIAFFLTVGRDRDVARALRNAGAAAAGAAVVIGPYLLRSWWYTQNPVFPFVNRIFPSPLAPPEIPRVSFGVGLKMPDVLTLPWQLFFGPTRFIETTGYNPALLASAGLALIVLVLSRRTTSVWFTAAAFSGLAWVATEQNTRYSLFVALFFVVGLVTGLPDLTQRLGRGARSALNAGSLVIVLLGFAGHVLLPDFWLGNGQSGPLFPIDILEHRTDREAYLTAHVHTFRTAQFVNDALGSSATVAQLNVRDHLYFRFSTFSFPHSIWPVTQLLWDVYYGSHTPEAILDDLKAAGITHLLVDMDNPNFAQTADSERKGFFAPEFVARRLQLEFADRGLRLYRLLEADHPEKNVPVSMSINLLALANTAPASQPRDIEVEVPVQGGTLYRVTLDRAPADGQPDSQLRVIWRDSSRKLLLFEALAVPESRNGGEYQTFQTAPPGATLASVQTKNLSLRAARIAPGER